MSSKVKAGPSARVSQMGRLFGIRLHSRVSVALPALLGWAMLSSTVPTVGSVIFLGNGLPSTPPPERMFVNEPPLRPCTLFPLPRPELRQLMLARCVSLLLHFGTTPGSP